MGQIIRLGLLAAFLVLISACGAPQSAAPQSAPQAGTAPGGFTTISVADLKARLDAGEQLTVLDVRTPQEFTGDGHIAGAKLLPLDELGARMGELAKDEPIACFCRSGNRSRTACTQLAEAGYTNLVNVDGGISAWAAAGYPVER
jgi:rhodanese-related sulfurtransferase